MPARRTLLLVAFLCCAAIVACAQEEYPPTLWEAQHPSTTASDPAATSRGPATCSQARAQPLPARLAARVSQDAGAATSTTIYVDDLDRQFFEPLCGACHGKQTDLGSGGFKIASGGDFQTSFDAAVLTHMTSNGPTPGASDPTSDPTDPMPPFANGGKPFSQRPANDPVVIFAGLVEQWLAAGRPAAFTVTGDAGGSVGSSSGSSVGFPLQPPIADSMTNIGNCIPSAGLVGTERTMTTQRDTYFAGLMAQAPGSNVTAQQMIGLPEHLGDTDLVTFDSSVLAQYGVVAYAPAYPLWSDDSGKLRHVRVPLGTSIHFDKATQEFSIPPNTRFYKTFMKRIVDTDGGVRWRKIETRVIVSRPDDPAHPNPDGSASKALFGTYRWNDDESDAVLVETLLHDNQPFADTVLQYNTDEQLAADVLLGQPKDPSAALFAAKAARHYAIPASFRCVECHQGSPGASFVLGFRPVQIARRPAGEGGVIVEPGMSPPGGDELTQLQRLIDYGVITGVDSVADILPLERSEANRMPRNDYELVAQGYVLGNCSHCHNPRGYPSVQFPVLAPVLSFLPGPTGGLFQFPLEKYSPRIARGPGGSEPIPYITPSLMDMPPPDWDNTALGEQWPEPDKYALKWSAGGLSATSPPNYVFFAPWRSLIYRNVDTPFTYSDDLALFPHMPMNTAGFDCRARQILSDWMVSIPSVRKDPEIPEYAIPTTQPGLVYGGTVLDANAQPYVEVVPGDPRYDDAQRAAQQRLAMLHTGVNPTAASGAYSIYQACPDTSDILDPAVENNACQSVPGPVVLPGAVELPTPGHAHWVTTDLTVPAGPWAPRRPDFATYLVNQSFPAAAEQGCYASPSDAQAAQDSSQLAVSLLQHIRVTAPSTSVPPLEDPTALLSFATHDIPVALWENKAQCHSSLSSAATAGSFAGATRPHWMENVGVDPSAPVYTEWPGAAVFGVICINCHGPHADGTGRLADNLATMTGGEDIVADLRDGLFGPVDAPGSNRAGVFDLLPPGTNSASLGIPSTAPSNWSDVNVDDRAARYLAWMALGGTQKSIPTSILSIIANTQVFGVPRVLPASGVSANMLSTAKAICASLLENPQWYGGSAFYGIDFDWTVGWFQTKEPGDLHLANFPDLIATNGDAELWMRLCTLNNPPPVHALFSFFPPGTSFPFDPTPTSGSATSGHDMFDSPLNPSPGTPYTLYPSDASVGNERGGVDAQLDASNLWPWCVTVPPPDFGVGQQGTTPADAQDHHDVGLAYLQSKGLPICPTLTTSWGKDDQGIGANSIEPPVQRWATRGAINAGLAVFLYLDGLAKGLTQTKPTYDHCEQL
jgi:mono/diheme cytochrome c family protein